MKILIYGAGTIGCTYGWQLSEAGYDITVLIREHKKDFVEKNGFNIHCSDYRGKEKQVVNTIFRPKVIDKLSPQNEFEYIIVSVNCLHLKEVLPVLAQSAGKAHILFFQNMWNDFDEIGKYLSSERYLFGFPFMAGGGKAGNDIQSIISGSKYSQTMLGEVNGEITPRVRKLADAIQKAGMKPVISTQIVTWLIPHYVFIAAVSAGVLKSGGKMEKFLKDSDAMKKALKAVREGFNICSARGINPKKEKVNKLYYLPLFISVPIVKKIFSNEDMSLMFDGYLKYSADEVKAMLENVIESGRRHTIKMDNLIALQSELTKL
ncbi:MAG: ketopantoate reductase family protein [Dysgonomonas sp.]